MFTMRIVRRAFTLVEMLVVIAVIGVLIGLLLPAVQSAREAGRRMQCSNNLKQLGLAMANYEGVYKIYPINWGDGTTFGDSTVGHSWLTGLLPYMEEKPLVNSIKLAHPMNYPVGSPPAYPNVYAARQAVPEFLCPSDYSSTNGTQLDLLPATSSAWTLTDFTLGVTNYKACAGMNWPMSADPVTNQRCDTPIYSQTGRNSGTTANSTDTDGLDHGNGIICRGCRKLVDAGGTTVINPLFTTSARDISDGLSRTFAIGEAVPFNCEASAWYSYEGGTATCALPLNYKEHDAAGNIVSPLTNRCDLGPPPNPKNKYYNRGFGSRHPGGAQFCMCDGSVNFISDDIECLHPWVTGDQPATYFISINSVNYVPGVYMNMATIDGGELFKAPGL